MDRVVLEIQMLSYDTYWYTTKQQKIMVHIRLRRCSLVVVYRFLQFPTGFNTRNYRFTNSPSFLPHEFATSVKHS